MFGILARTGDDLFQRFADKSSALVGVKKVSASAWRTPVTRMRLPANAADCCVDAIGAGAVAIVFVLRQNFDFSHCGIGLCSGCVTAATECLP